jgi:methionyl-tRNA formyltransferase
MSKKLRIVFMGTPEFAVAVLEQIVQGSHEIVSVVTSPDRPAGRGQKIRQSAVKAFSQKTDLPILQPEKLKDESFINELIELNADLFVVVAFRMLPSIVWKIPSKGTINLHASLLPNYRGAAPINWAIINGEKSTGVTTFFINELIDTGDIILTQEVEITESMNAGDLHDKLMVVGAGLMSQTLDAISLGDFKRNTQTISESKEIQSAPKIFKADCKINWDNDAHANHNKIRGLSPYPGAWCTLVNRAKSSDVIFKIVESSKTTMKISENRRTQLLLSENGILFPCSDHYICVTVLQMEGKRKMNYKEFIAGNSIEDLEISLES